MFKWISEFSHRRELREIQREKELKQAECVHNWVYLGCFQYERYNGFDVDFDYIYKNRCNKCGLEKSYNYEVNALAYCKKEE